MMRHPFETDRCGFVESCYTPKSLQLSLKLPGGRMSILKSIDRINGTIGKAVIDQASHIADLCALACRLISMIVKRPTHGRKLIYRIVIEQVYFTAVQALPIVIPLAIIMGGLMTIQAAKLTSQYDLGKYVVAFLIREMGPVATALIVLVRSGIAMTIEVSYGQILNETEALEMQGIDPLDVVAYPRLLGITSAMLSLFVVFDITAVLGGSFTAWLVTDAPISPFLRQVANAIHPADIWVGILKALFFGIIMTVTSQYRAFTIQKQMTAIPRACSGMAIETMFYCLAVNIFISVIFYL